MIERLHARVPAGLAKSISEGGGKSPEELELAVRQIVSRAILSDEFLAEVKHLPQRNLAVELLQKNGFSQTTLIRLRHLLPLPRAKESVSSSAASSANTPTRR
jgi:hypothetical protein